MKSVLSPDYRKVKMKKFQKYIKQNETDLQRLALQVGVSLATVYTWRAGRSKPSVAHAIKLERITRGAVSVYDWA